MASYASGSEDELSRRGSPPPRGLFSDDESDDDRGRGRISEAEEDNSLNRREGGAAAAGTQDRNTDDEEEEERKRQEKKKKDEEKKKKPKGPVRRQMISEEMLTGKNGISILPDLFQDFTFGGKGRERQDLDKILSKLEHWIHLLHPKQPFDQSLQRIEFLGGKRKILKGHLKRIRMGMINNYEEENDLVVEENDEMNNIDASELAESASAFVNRELGEMEEIVDEPIPSSSAAMATATSANAANNDDEFPDDDDEFFEIVNETAAENLKSMEDEMDVDMEDIPDVNDDEEDDFIQKQIDAQMKRAQQADTQQAEKSQLPEENISEKQSEPDAHATSSSINDSVVVAESVDDIDLNAVPVDNPVSPTKSVEDNMKDIKEMDSAEGTKAVNVAEAATMVIDGNATNDDDDGIDLDDLEDNDD